MSGISESLAPLFGGVDPTFLTDSSGVVAALRERGARARSFDELASIPRDELANIVTIPVQYERTPTSDVIEEHFGDSAMLVIPIGSFCGTDRGALYVLDMLSSIDLERCVSGVKAWLDLLSNASAIAMAGHGTDITAKLEDEVWLMSPKASMLIAPGEWVSLAQYLEVGLVTDRRFLRSSHHMEGTLAAEGFALAHDRFAAQWVQDHLSEVWEFLSTTQERHDGAPFVLEVENSCAVSITCGSQEVLREVLGYTKDAGELVGEFAFAADDQWDLDAVDWTVNSQLNEAIGGLHIGLGNGIKGAHIDFVAPRATLRDGSHDT